MILLEKLLYLALAIFGVVMLVKLWVVDRRHSALMGRMASYTRWVKARAGQMTPNEMRHVERVLSRKNPEYRGPWE